jgi:hypothetical protein
MKIRPVRAELFHADGRTDITKLVVAFRNFADAPKNWDERAEQLQYKTTISEKRNRPTTEGGKGEGANPEKFRKKAK